MIFYANVQGFSIRVDYNYLPKPYHFAYQHATPQRDLLALATLIINCNTLYIMDENCPERRTEMK